MTKAKKTFTPTTTNVEAVLSAPENAIPFLDENAGVQAIVLPGSAFFDQELGDVIFNKLMRAPVKDYQVLLRLSKLGNTINKISANLTKIRDAVAKDCDLDPANLQLTAEVLNDPTYQEKTKAFGTMLNEYVFSKRISLFPLGVLNLDLTNPDGHAKAFIEGSTLSASDINMLDELGIIKVVYPEDENDDDDDTVF